uniref:Uncharacterized protein n=1 Tax=Rhizophora mucronata TaxID=61149 RepID=A0A2P2PPP4_RHIMU
MAQLVCSQVDGCDSVDFTKFLMALVIAIALLATCIPPPRRVLVCRLAR